jgi:TonB family protein
MMKYCSAFLFAIIIQPLFGQEKIHTFFDKDGNLADSNCHYMSVRKVFYNEVDSIFEVFCTSNRLKAIWQVDDRGVKNGDFVSFYENGNRESAGKYKDGNRIGLFIDWYKSKKLRMQSTYEGAGTNEPRIMQYWDSLGNMLVRDGEGTCECILDDYEDGLVQRGKVANGLKHETWKGYKGGVQVFDEVYKNGELLNGKSFDQSGEVYPYSKILELPTTGDKMGFYEQVMKKIKYPSFAKRMGVEGKVFVQFIIEKDGTVSNVQTIKGIGAGCDAEAERVVASTTGWTPGKLRGKAVRQKMVLPINFKLG